MNNNDYEFTAIWQPYPTTDPQNGTRCLITNGDVVTFGTYVVDGDGKSIWLIPELDSAHPFTVIGWMDSPKPMIKRVVYEETSEQNKRVD